MLLLGGAPSSAPTGSQAVSPPQTTDISDGDTTLQWGGGVSAVPPSVAGSPTTAMSQQPLARADPPGLRSLQE